VSIASVSPMTRWCFLIGGEGGNVLQYDRTDSGLKHKFESDQLSNLFSSEISKIERISPLAAAVLGHLDELCSLKYAPLLALLRVHPFAILCLKCA
jgi:hypothetical protein